MNYLIILLATFLFYGPSLKYGFSQDDFFFLKLAQAHNLKDILLFFSPFHQQGFPFYRPLGTQFYFYVFRSLFGLDKAPFFMHLFMLFLQAINGYLVFKLIRRFKFSRSKALFSGIIYAIAAPHFLSLFYIAATQHLLATTFSLLALLSFLDEHIGLTLTFLFFGLLSKENTLFVVFPMISLFFFERKLNKKNALLLFKRLIYPLILFGSYFVFRFYGGITVQSDYKPILDHRIVQTLRFYLSFLFGFFEKIQDYPLSNFKQYFLDTRVWGKLVFFTFIIEMGLLFKNFLIALRKKRSQVIISLLMIVLPLLPYLGLPNHIFPHYLEFSLLGFVFLILTIFNAYSFYLFIVIFLINNFASIRTSLMLHWSPLRSQLNAHYLPFIRQQICSVKTNKIVFSGDPRLVKELYYSLSGSNGPQVICNNFNLRVYYKGLNLRKGVSSGAKVIELTPKILNHD